MPPAWQFQGSTNRCKVLRPGPRLLSPVQHNSVSSGEEKVSESDNKVQALWPLQQPWQALQLNQRSNLCQYQLSLYRRRNIGCEVSLFSRGRYCHQEGEGERRQATLKESHPKKRRERTHKGGSNPTILIPEWAVRYVQRFQLWSRRARGHLAALTLWLWG